MLNIIKKNKLFLASCIVLFSLLVSKSAQAICPVCTIAVGVGVGLSRWLGVDDMISGVWIGGLLASMTAWANTWFKAKTKKEKLKFFSLPIIAIFFYAITVIPLDWAGIMGHPLNKFMGFDKLLIGIAGGTLFFILGVGIHYYLKAQNNDKVYFPYQKVVVPVLSLTILSLIFYYLTS